MVSNIIKRTDLDLKEMLALDSDELGKLARGRANDPIYQKYGGKEFKTKQAKRAGTQKKLEQYSDKDLKKLQAGLAKAVKAGEPVPVELDPRK